MLSCGRSAILTPRNICTDVYKNGVGEKMADIATAIHEQACLLGDYCFRYGARSTTCKTIISSHDPNLPAQPP